MEISELKYNIHWCRLRKQNNNHTDLRTKRRNGGNQYRRTTTKSIGEARKLMAIGVWNGRIGEDSSRIMGDTAEITNILIGIHSMKWNTSGK